MSSDTPTSEAPPPDRSAPPLKVVEGGGAKKRIRPRRPHASDRPPIVTYLLLVAIGLVFLAMLRVGNGDVTAASEAFGRKDNALIREGEWWRLITPIFLHGNWSHILVNAMSLYWLGAELESLYGHRRYFLVYMVAGIAGNYVSFLRNPAPSLGASGAIFGLVGAAIIFPMRYRSLVPERFRRYVLSRMGTVALVNLAIGFAMPRYVDNWAHLGGLLGGGFAALFFKPEALERGTRARLNEGVVYALLAGMLGLIGLSGWLQWRNVTGPAPLVRYPVDSDKAWFSLSAPRTWQRFGSETSLDGSWVVPNAAGIVLVTDSAHDLRAVEEQVELVLGSGRNAQTLQIGGKPARHRVVQTSQAVQDIYLVEPAPQRVIGIMLEARPTTYAAVAPDFQRLISSVRFLRAPSE